MLTERENYLIAFNGGVPEWLPCTMYQAMQDGYTAGGVWMVPSKIFHSFGPDGIFDIWGQEYIATKETGYQFLPKPNQWLIDDISNWRNVLKAPDISGIDWEEMARQDFARAKLDPTQTAVIASIHLGYFLEFSGFMGFENCLMAMYEEPEEVYAMFSYMSDFYTEVERKFIQYYKPDIWMINDDISTATMPFMSLDMYRQLLKPFHAREAAIAREAGILVGMHCCGYCQDFIDDWLEIGVQCWQPAQSSNDLAMIKKKYAGRLALEGCLDNSGKASQKGTSEEWIRNEVRRIIDAYAPGGGYIFWPTVLGNPEDPEYRQRFAWVVDEYNKYGRPFYSRQKEGK